MLVLCLVGLGFIVLSGVVNAIELRKFFKALAALNGSTNSFIERLAYPFRFVAISRYLAPLIPDIILMSAAGAIGLGGGVLGSIIAIGGSCCVCLIIKAAYAIAKHSTRAYSL